MRGQNHLATNSYMRYHIVGSLELVHLMLGKCCCAYFPLSASANFTWLHADDYKYTGDEAIVTKYLLPVADAVLTFYREHFPARDAQNKTVFFPTQALETWQVGCDVGLLDVPSHSRPGFTCSARTFRRASTNA